MSFLPCEVIRDLLPLYIDNCCSQASCTLVEEHLDACPSCKQEWKDAVSIDLNFLGNVADDLLKNESEEQPAETMKKGLKKVKKKWITSIIAVAVAIALLIPIGILSINQFAYDGICFSNLNELRIANAFLENLKNGDYNAAFQLWDWEYAQENSCGILHCDEEYLPQLKNDVKTVFLESAQPLIDAGGLTDYRYDTIQMWTQDKNGEWNYCIYYTATVGETKYDLRLGVSDQGVIHMASGFYSFPNPDPLMALGLWTSNFREKYKGHVYMDENSHIYLAIKS